MNCLFAYASVSKAGGFDKVFPLDQKDWYVKVYLQACLLALQCKHFKIQEYLENIQMGIIYNQKRSCKHRSNSQLDCCSFLHSTRSSIKSWLPSLTSQHYALEKYMLFFSVQKQELAQCWKLGCIIPSVWCSAILLHSANIYWRAVVWVPMLGIFWRTQGEKGIIPVLRWNSLIS